MEKSLISLIEELVRVRKMQQRKILQQSSLHVGQPAMLSFVQKHPGCSQKQMADEARVTAASIAASFKRLENAGLISRRADTADTRCNRVYITKAGESELDFCQEALLEIDKTMTDGINRMEIEVIENMLQKMIDNLKRLENK